MIGLTRKIVHNITPPIITSCVRKIVKDRNLVKAQESGCNGRSDEYINWLCWTVGGFLTSDHGNLRAFDYAVRQMPKGGAIVEIGSFLGLSTNIITYLTVKYHCNNPLFTCDPWVFENSDKPVGGYFDAGNESFRDYAKKVFMMNAMMFSKGKEPYTIETYSHQFFRLWRICATTEDVFGRRVALGGPISFAYVDGAHTYDAAKGDFLGVDQHLLPGGFILFDDSADGSDWEVRRVVAEVERDPSYELVFKTPNYFFRKRGCEQ
jgi:hypothetical protein